MAGIITGPLTGEGADYNRDSPRRELIYAVINTDDQAEVYTLTAGEAPSTYMGLPLSAISVSALGGGVWSSRVNYTKRSKDDTIRLRGSTKGGVAHRTHGLGDAEAYWKTGLDSSLKPDFAGAINVENGEAKGVDYQVPVFPFSIEAKVDASTLPSNYLQILYLLTGTVNTATVVFVYRGQTLTFTTQELVFRGADFDIPNDGEATFVYDFEASPTVEDLLVGGVNVEIKYGWEYVWPYMDPIPSSGALVPTVRGVFTHKIYPYDVTRGVAFSDLIYE